MPKKTIFVLGFDIPEVEGVEVLPIESDRSLLDADIICIRPSIMKFEGSEIYDGRTIMNQHNSVVWRDLKSRWLPRINSALESGKTIIFFVPRKHEKFFYTGQKQYSGTGKNQKTTNIVHPASNMDLIPINFDSTEYSFGKSMIMDSSGEVISNLWNNFGHLMRYNFIFSLGTAQPLIKTKTGNRIVGALWKRKGSLLVLPDLDLGEIQQYQLDEHGDEIEDEDGWGVYTQEILETSIKLRDDLISIDTFLKQGREATPPPSWSDSTKFRLNREEAIESEILDIGSKIESLSADRDRKRQELSTAGQLRGLLFEKGLPLEAAVRDALSTLGFNVDHFKDEDSEFDALFTSDEGRFLGEVEGKDSKAINVDKISQLQRNLTEDFSKDGIEELATGVLFGNAFRLTAPEERGDFFTEKTLKVSKISNISLVKTTDLFFVSQYVKNTGDTDFAKKCRHSISFGAGGVVAFPAPPAEISPSTSVVLDESSSIGGTDFGQ